MTVNWKIFWKNVVLFSLIGIYGGINAVTGGDTFWDIIPIVLIALVVMRDEPPMFPKKEAK